MVTARVELPDVVSYVLARADEDDLIDIAQAITRRWLHLQETVPVLDGATVTIEDVTPTYLTGLSGVVKEITPGLVGYVTITLDHASTNTLAASARKYAHLAGRHSYDLYGVPMSCCRVTGP